jgi:MoaA/NifB/PqqE/SkfB family radical SAM enzyme
MNWKYHLESVKHKIAPSLTKLWIENTDLCNSRCGTCSIWKRRESESKLTPDTLFNLLSNNIFRNVDYIINSGGEPSIIDLAGFLRAEHKALPKATLQVSTNGLLPDKVFDAVESAVSDGAKVEVGISLDGVGESHDMIRGVKGNFEHVDYLIRKLKPLCQVTVGSTLTDRTVKYGNVMVYYTKNTGVPFMWHWANQSAFYGDGVANVSKENAEKALCLVPNSYYKSMWLRSLNGKPQKFRCSALTSFAVIKCSGEVVPCLSHWNRSIGNMLTDDPQRIWRGAKEQRRFVKSCSGCLNSWGCGWSLQQQYTPLLKYAIKRRITL